MRTDCNQIRSMMNAAIEACERIEATGYPSLNTDATVDTNRQKVSVQDFLTSAWAYPENIRYRIINARHDAGDDLH